MCFEDVDGDEDTEDIHLSLPTSSVLKGIKIDEENLRKQ